MKTLDEVITTLDYCMFSSDCTPCAYKQTKDCQRTKSQDALHYLRQYRSDKVEWEAQKKAYEDWIEQYKEARDKHQQAVIELKKNDPLSWDELKQMEGKPVWVEPVKEWMLITEIDKEEDQVWLLSLDGQDYDFGSHNWQAYRKERG